MKIYTGFPCRIANIDVRLPASIFATVFLEEGGGMNRNLRMQRSHQPVLPTKCALTNFFKLCVILIFLSGCAGENNKEFPTKYMSQTDPGGNELISEYASSLKALENKRVVLSEQYTSSQSESARLLAINNARNVLYGQIVGKIISKWYGTAWDFNGTTRTPGRGEIACGYFVTTVLCDAGFRLQREKLAQQPSEVIIKSLTTEKYIKRFSNTPIEEFISAIKQWGHGFYLVGLDIHVGFVIYNAGGIFFIHSSYMEPREVVKELARESTILSSSRYRVLGKLSSDDTLLVDWLLGNNIKTLAY